MMVLESTNVPNAFYTGSHTSEEFLVEMKRTYANTFTISTQGKCVGAKGALGPCPADIKPKGKGKAYKRAAAPMMKSSWYVEPLLSQPFDKAGGHEGHDHSEPSTMVDAHAGHDHANGSHEPAPTFSSWTSGIPGFGGSSTGIRMPSTSTMVLPAGHSMDDGHDHSGDGHDGHDHSSGSHTPASSWSNWGTQTAGHSMDDGHDHSSGKPASSFSTRPKCSFVNGKFVCN
jgi:hypothetical protein